MSLSFIYPEWSPAVLRARHAELERAASTAEDGAPARRNARIFRLLLTDTQMASVWPALSTAAEKRGLPDSGSGPRSWEYEFAVSVVCADAPLKNWEDCAPAEQRKKLRAIAKGARSAASAMREFRDTEYFFALALVARFGTEQHERLWSWLGRDATLLSLDAASHGVHVSLADVLEAVAQDCEDAPVPLTHASKADNPAALAFVRRLHTSMIGQFGQPLHQCVASVATALYPDCKYDAERVRGICRTAPGKNSVKTAKLLPVQNKNRTRLM